VHRQLDQALEAREGLLRTGRVQVHGEHAATPGDLPQQAAAPAHHQRAVLQREGPGDGGGGDLTLAVADDDIGPYAGPLPRRGQ
jgi:hypothetical protein